MVAKIDPDFPILLGGKTHFNGVPCHVILDTNGGRGFRDLYNDRPPFYKLTVRSRMIAYARIPILPWGPEVGWTAWEMLLQGMLELATQVP